MPAPASRRAQRNPGRSQVVGRCLPTDPGLPLNPAQRPPQAAQRDHFLPLRFAQDIAHLTERSASVVNVLSQPPVGRFSGDPVWPLLGDPRGLHEANGLDLSKIKMTSAFSNAVKYQLGMGFWITLAYDRRHIWQTRQLCMEEGFS